MSASNTVASTHVPREPLPEPGVFEYTFLAVAMAALLALFIATALIYFRRKRIRRLSKAGDALRPGERPAPEWLESLNG